jgi:hypothetical protein
MPLNKFIATINEPLKGLVSGIKVYGLAQSVSRGAQVVPAVVGKDGEMVYVGPDDLQPVIVYHKAGNIAVGTSANVRGVGDEPNGIVNRYPMAMIIYLDQKKTNLSPDQLFLYVQANFPDFIRMEPYSNVVVTVNNIILNAQQVFDSEFRGVDPLPASQSLMQIYYTIESTFRKKCFEKCPEEC